MAISGVEFYLKAFFKVLHFVDGPDGKKAPPDRPEYKNSFLDQIQSPRPTGSRKDKKCWALFRYKLFLV